MRTISYSRLPFIIGTSALVALLLTGAPADASWVSAADVSVEAVCDGAAINPGQGCNDGNVADGDGCSAAGTVELGYKCVQADASRCVGSDPLADQIDAGIGDPDWGPVGGVGAVNGVTQNNESDPTVYLTRVLFAGAGQIELGVYVSPDAVVDDFVGIVLGYDAGDLTNTGAEYLLLSWEGDNRGAGLNMSLVRGAPTLGDLEDYTGAVTSLSPSFGNGDPLKFWSPGTYYTWKVDYTETYMKVEIFVDGSSLGGFDLTSAGAGLSAWPVGSLGFFVLGQDKATFTLETPAVGELICAFNDLDDVDPANVDDDEDNDGIPDAQENPGDLDPDGDSDDDGVPNYLDIDDRGDGTGQACSGDKTDFGACQTTGAYYDEDGDGQPNHRDLDADGDSIPDYVEAGHWLIDSDGDGFVDGEVGANGMLDKLEEQADVAPIALAYVLRDTDSTGNADFLDLDSDDDNIADKDEAGDEDIATAPYDNDGDNVPNYRDPDSDGDNISDEVEAGDENIATAAADDDGDGEPNYLDLDSDDDNIADKDEAGDDDLNTAPDDEDGDGEPNYLDIDSDGDEIPDRVEAGDDDLNTAPDDEDRDGAPNYLDIDSDGDEIPDEVEAGGSPNNPVDTDKDDKPDYRDVDSDNDTIPDQGEAGVDPNDPVDTDGDGDPDYRDPDSDNDTRLDGEDNCRLVANSDQYDADGDGVGYACDTDQWHAAGTGCSSTDGGAAGALFPVLMVLALVWRRRRGGLSRGGVIGLTLLLAVGLLGAATTLAHAQAQSDFAAERFRLAVDGEGVLDVEWAEVSDHLDWDMALWLGSEDEPLVLYRNMDGGEQANALVSNRIAGSLIGGVSLWKRVQVGLEVPLVVAQSFDPVDGFMTTASSSFGLGDIRLLPKVQLLSAERHGVHLALMPALTLPTGKSDSYIADGSFGFAPEVIASRAFGAVRVSGNLGYRLRSNVRIADLRVEDELFAHVGAGYRFDADGDGLPLEVDLTVSSATAAASPFGDSNRNHLELRGGASYRVFGPVEGIVAGGLGIQEGFGTPGWRAVVGVRLSAPRAADDDGDNIPDAEDGCPLAAEDKDGFEDQDGCPEFDNDGDGVPDDVDGAPDQAEDHDAYQDEDGVPDPDNDGDGIADEADECPLEAETQNGIKDEDGCPDDFADSDGDQVADEADQCPQQAEDLDGFIDEDGCPDPDDDGDGVVDESDRCRSEAGPVENRGCPDSDRDGDTIVDRLDNCPDEAGPSKNHGCPKKQSVRLVGNRLDLLDHVYFANNEDRILPRSYAILSNVADVLLNHPEYQGVRVEGHCDSRGDAAHNLDLSQRRAESVVTFLVERGVPRERLEAQGFGETRPIADNGTAKGRAANRRVEFHIVNE